MQRLQRSLSCGDLPRTHCPRTLVPAPGLPSEPGSPRRGGSRVTPIHIDGPSAVDALVQSLRRPDAEVPALRLHLSAHVEAPALAELLATLDQLAAQGELVSLVVTVADADRGPIPQPLRWALAGSKACLVLSGATVRRLILGDPAWVQDPKDPTLVDFLNMTLCGAMDHALEVQAAGALSRLAMQTTGEDALLRAAAVLSPGYQWRFEDLPDPGVYKRLVNAQVSLCVNLSLTRATIGPLAQWLEMRHPLLRSIEVRVSGCLEGPAWMLLWTRVVAQASLRNVEVEIRPQVVVEDMAAQEGLPLRPLARMEAVRLCVHGADEAPLAAWLVEWLHPMDLTLRTHRVDTTRALLKALEDPAPHDTLRDLRIICSGGVTGPRDVGLVKALIDFLQRFDRVRRVYLSLPHPLPGGATLQVLRAVVLKNLLLKWLQLVYAAPSSWMTPVDMFGKPLWQGFGQGNYFQAHGVGGLRAFFHHHLHNDRDLAYGFMEREWLPMSDLVSLSGVSADTRREAVKLRSESHAQEIVRVMRLGLFDPFALRELLTGPAGEIDPDLVLAVFLQLCDAREDPDLWRPFDEATAFH